MNTEEFEKILDETVIPAYLPTVEQLALIYKLTKYISPRIPEALYRYRSCNERNVEAFYNDHVYVSAAKNMNDGFDARLYFDSKALKDWVGKSISESEIKDYENFFKEMFLSDSDEAQEYRRTNGFSNMSKVPPTFIEETIREMVTRIKEEAETGMSLYPSEMQNSLKFCCLSENIASASMWGLYANNEEGFALSYNLRNIELFVSEVDGFQRVCRAYPIIYSDHRYLVCDVFMQFMLKFRVFELLLRHEAHSQNQLVIAEQSLNKFFSNCPDIMVPTKVALYKSREWEREQEWRVFCKCPEDIKFTKSDYGYFIKKPSGLFLGRRIRPINEKILTDIAKEKNLPVYKMNLDDTDSTYVLKPKRVL